VLVIVIVGILGALIGPALNRSMTAADEVQSDLSDSAKLRYALERIAREVREVRRSTADDANFDITAMTATALTFLKNDAQQVSITFAAPLVTVNYVGTASGTLTDDVNGAPALPCRTGFRYFQLDGTTAATSSANIAFVEAAVTLSSSGYCNRTRVDLRTPQ
jgi:type II secretory pathway pseudopilin PulG